MDSIGWLVWGLGGTVLLTVIMAGAQSLRLTRMSLPYLLGTMFTANRDRAKVYGIMIHLVNGWIFSLIYIGAFHARGEASWWFGLLIGLAHSAFVLMVGMPAIPGMHPRMAGEGHGPSTTRLLQPPGFLALHYGHRTPIAIVIAHLAFGAFLGGFYTISN